MAQKQAMSSAQIIVTGHVLVQKDRLADALALALTHVQRSRTEPGCLSHAVHQDVENSLRLVFVEEWADQAALMAHFAVPASRAFVRDLGQLSTAPPHMAIFEARPVRMGG